MEKRDVKIKNSGSGGWDSPRHYYYAMWWQLYSFDVNSSRKNHGKKSF